MKTILYNPIFINPQAYYVFPRLTRYLQPDNESTAEPANYIGTIEVKVIAYGDTTLKRTYTNTDSIDLSEFKNTWIRISLFTKVGSCVLGEWKIGNMESDLPYIDPEVLASLKAVVIVGNKTNNDSDRAIVKNLVDPDNPFVISNAAYTEGSGYADKDSPYYGAFVTDGIDDLITSTKTVQEMLGGSNEITVVSMAHFIKGESNAPEICRINQIRRDTRSIRNSISKIGKSGIFGYTYKNGVTTINNILGDKNDCTAEGNLDGIVAPFSVEGYYYNNNSNPLELCSIAWYWTIIANKVLTTDQINQVIAYFNLDRTLKPDILCNIGKQGITNDNHADFNDKLVDYSGNGRDVQMNNLAWKGGSGIAAKPFETIKDYTIISDEARQKLTIYNEFSYKIKSNTPSYYWTVQSIIRDNTSYQVTIITDKDCYWINATSFINSEGNKESIRKKYPVLANTPTQVIICGLDQFEYPEGIEPTSAVSCVNLEYAGEITITFIPSHKGGLLLDGVNDFGKVTGIPVYKDYTFIIDRQIISIGDTAGVVASKSENSSDATKHGAFIFEYLGAPDNISTWSFYKDNGKVANTDFTRGISYQSKYSYNGKDLTVGTSKDSDKLWLGTIRDRDSRFFNGAIYSLMSFPYSMSKFLIERQLKKYKLGTLYPNMVEFRPVINSNVLLDSKPTFVIRGTNTYLNAGDYVPENSQIWISIKMNNIADRITKFTVNGKTIDIPENAYSEVTLQYGFPFVIDKSPQKIGITIEQDENYVLFNPVINSNYDNYKLTFHLREYEKLINIGDYIPKGTYIRANLYLKNNIDELVTFTFNGVNIDYAKSPVLDTAYNIRQIYNYDSPQEVNITIDEYIRYEDIVQPYPVLLRFNDENGNEVSWGGKFRVGSTITRIGSIADPESNLLNGLYSISGLSLNGKSVTSSTSIVEKRMVFKTIATYLLDNNEPKCILSPRLLRIPNSSYKILGYIPDISGHGNHGVIHNSAYGEGSGVNEDGSYQFDGVDDFVTIPTVTGGGKQVLMKVNNNTINSMLYDQRSSGASPNSLYNDFAIYCTNSADNNQIAYQSRLVGNTYIDGILNTNITCEDLLGVLHNITITCDIVAPNNGVVPNIGRGGVLKDLYSKVALYDFMLFDNISTDDKIKELNEYIGIEAKVELPPYYWDAYGKTNLDEDKATIQQRGVAVGDYDLTNHNHAYEGMSGYNGYPVVFGANKTWENFSSVYSYTSDVTSTTIHITRVKNAGTGLLFSYVKKDGALTNIREIPAFRVTVKGLEGNSKFGYRYLATEDATVETLVYLGNGTHELSKSFTPTEALLDLTRNAWVGIFITPMVEGEVVFDCDITIEVLPEYENGLVYDGVDDYSKNENIPVLTDYTIIAKRLWINKDNPLNEQFIHKGAINTPISESAFMLEYEIANDTYYRSSSYGGYINIERSNRPERIVYQTSNSYNGISITKGSGTDTTGIVIGGVTNNYWNGVFYKLMLYSKTLPLLQINYLKNLMEKDEIIDLNNKIFIQE